MTLQSRNLSLTAQFFVLIVASFYSTSALKCFQCQLKDGVGDTGCEEEPPPDKYLRECAQPQCWLRHSNNGTVSVERFCVAFATNTNECVDAVVVDTKGASHAGKECKCNNADGCNGNSPSLASGELQSQEDGQDGKDNKDGKEEDGEAPSTTEHS